MMFVVCTVRDKNSRNVSETREQVLFLEYRKPIVVQTTRVWNPLHVVFLAVLVVLERSRIWSIGSLIFAIMVCLCDLATAEIDLNEHNVVPNASFELGKSWPENWSRICRENGDRVQFKWDNHVAHSGQHSVMICSQPIDESCWGAWLCDVPVRGGIQWYFAGWLKSEKMTRGGLLGWLWHGDKPISFGSTCGTSDWSKGECIVDVPEDQTILTIGLEFRRATGRGWADDVLAVPYFIKLTADLLLETNRLSAQELLTGVAEDFYQWQDSLFLLSKDVIHWRNAPIERLRQYQIRAIELRAKLGEIEDRIALARFTDPLVVGCYAPVTSVYRNPAEWPANDFEEAIDIRAMRGETESFQLALLSPGRDMARIHVAFDALKSATGQSIAPEQIMLYRVEYVEYKTQAAEHDNLWPDVLVPSSEFELRFGVERRTQRETRP